MRHRTPGFTLALIAVLALIVLPAWADSSGSAHFHHGHGAGHWHHHRSHWGMGIGIGFGPGACCFGAPWYPDTLLVAPAPWADDESLSNSRAPASPDPVITPRHGQSAAQTEADRRACNRWAMTQASAMDDAAVFHRTTLACMEERGYTVGQAP